MAIIHNTSKTDQPLRLPNGETLQFNKGEKIEVSEDTATFVLRTLGPSNVDVFAGEPVDGIDVAPAPKTRKKRGA